jgi:hypothetical protein
LCPYFRYLFFTPIYSKFFIALFVCAPILDIYFLLLFIQNFYCSILDVPLFAIDH